MSPNTADDRPALAERPGYAVELERELDRVMDHMTSRVDLPGRQIALI